MSALSGEIVRHMNVINMMGPFPLNTYLLSLSFLSLENSSKNMLELETH